METKAFMTPKIAIVILNWNGKDDTLECLASVFKLDYPNFSVIVVDNGSTDGSVAAIRQDYPQVTLIETGRNLGYAGGNNVGIRYALDQNAEFIFLLNNDTIVSSNILTELISASKRFPEAGILGPKIYYYSKPEIIWSAGGYWDQAQQCFEQIGDGEIDKGQFDQETPTDFIVGCALFIKAECFHKIGLLDEGFFLNYEEIDFEYRAKQHGFKLLYVPKARLWHKVSSSFAGEHSPLKTYFTYRNRLLWASRHLPKYQKFQVVWSVYYKFFKHIADPIFASLKQGSLKKLWWTMLGVFTSPHIHTIGQAIWDFHCRRLGDCPPKIRTLQIRWKKLHGL
jgi:GT2 family glycosyltransferase